MELSEPNNIPESALKRRDQKMSNHQKNGFLREMLQIIVIDLRMDIYIYICLLFIFISKIKNKLSAKLLNIGSKDQSHSHLERELRNKAQ